VREKARELVSLVGGPYHGAMQNTQTYLAMTHEQSSGTMTLVNDRLQLSWPDIGKEPIFEKVNDRLIEATAALGGTFTAYVDNHADWKNRLLDAALALYPTPFEEHCPSGVCRRIALLYATLYEHDQLNAATHDAMHELFGDATISAFEHLGRIANAKHLVAADGSEIYMDKLERLAIPTAFIHGAENECYLPRSTEETVAALSQINGAALYRRHVIPDYGHIDCIFGKSAARDVYPLIVEHLDATR